MAKPTRREEVEVELIFDFCDGKKPESYPLRYNEDFFSSRKFEEQLKIRFRSTEGVCLASLGKRLAYEKIYWQALLDKANKRLLKMRPSLGNPLLTRGSNFFVSRDEL